MKTTLRTQGTVELSSSDIRDLIVESLKGKGFEITRVMGIQPITCNITVTEKMKLTSLSKGRNMLPPTSSTRPNYGLRGEFVTAMKHFWTLGWRQVPFATMKTFIEGKNSKFEVLSLDTMIRYFTRKDIALFLSEKVPGYLVDDSKINVHFRSINTSKSKFVHTMAPWKRDYLNKLTDDFTKSQAVLAGSNEKTVENYLREFIERGLIKRIRHGQYQKIR